jgi:hypothetical protein
MRYRLITLRVDDILNIFKDYCSPDDIPPNSTPVTLQIHPTTKKIALLIDSPDIPQGGGGEIEVRFDLKRSYSLNR